MGFFASPYYGSSAGVFGSPYYGEGGASPAGRSASSTGFYWASTYWPSRYLAPRHWNDGVLGPAVPITGLSGLYWPPTYWAGTYWTGKYWPGNAATPPAKVSAYDRFSQVLLAVQSKIVAGGFYSATQVAISLKDGPFPLFGSDFCYIKPLERNADQGSAEGAGRYVSSFVTRFIVRVFKRLPTDTATLDAHRLTDASVGLLMNAYKVLDQLQMFHPVDSASRLLTTEPIRQQNAGVSIKFAENDDPSYLRIDLYFEAKIRPPVNLNVNT